MCAVARFLYGAAHAADATIGAAKVRVRLEAAGGKPKHTYIEGGNHHAWDPAWANPELVPWLFSQTKAGRAEGAAGKSSGDGVRPAP